MRQKFIGRLVEYLLKMSQSNLSAQSTMPNTCFSNLVQPRSLSSSCFSHQPPKKGHVMILDWMRFSIGAWMGFCFAITAKLVLISAGNVEIEK